MYLMFNLQQFNSNFIKPEFNFHLWENKRFEHSQLSYFEAICVYLTGKRETQRRIRSVLIQIIA